MTDSIRSGGCLMVVATPIGNLGDMTPRAVDALRQASLIAAEDTRHSGALTRHFGINTPMTALHEHNEADAADRLVEKMLAGERIALISDAGTPLVSDPGYVLVRTAQQQGVAVLSYPGPCAAIAGLSTSGQASDRFVFEGFLPARATARKARLQVLQHEPRTLVFYESSHRIESCLADMAEVFGPDRSVSIAREITKMHEESALLTLAEAGNWLRAHEHRRRGEFVVTVAGAAVTAQTDKQEVATDQLIAELLPHMPLKAAVAVVVRLTGLARNDIYQQALLIRDQSQG